MQRCADALLAALHGGRTLWCVQGHHLVGFNHYATLKLEAKFYPGRTTLENVWLKLNDNESQLSTTA